MRSTTPLRVRGELCAEEIGVRPFVSLLGFGLLNLATHAFLYNRCGGDFYLERQFPEMHARHPSSITPSHTQLPNLGKWATNASTGAIVHAWRPGHWYSWMFGIGRSATSAPTKGWTISPNTNGIFGMLDAPKTSNAAVAYLGSFDTQNECFGACNATAGCNDWTWHTPSFPEWGKGCYTMKNGDAGECVHDVVLSFITFLAWLTLR